MEDILEAGGGELDCLKVKQAADEEAAAIATADPDRYFAVLAEDAVFLAPNLMPLEGDELRDWLRDFLNTVHVEYIESAHGETAVAGDLAYHEYTCSWRVTPKPEGEAKVAHFKGLHIARRMPDGAWKLTRNMWNQNPKAASAR